MGPDKKPQQKQMSVPFKKKEHINGKNMHLQNYINIQQRWRSCILHIHETDAFAETFWREQRGGGKDMVLKCFKHVVLTKKEIQATETNHSEVSPSDIPNVGWFSL